MPKDRRVHSLSIDRSRASPYPCSSNNVKQCKPENPSGSIEDVKEWEEARCPICMEHPHNAVLLKCSSYEKGCRPYMCNTSYRHSNCLDQFCKSSVSSPSTANLQEISPAITISHTRGEEWPLPGQTMPSGNQLQPNLVCPLCRGEIYGWIVVEPARHLMNSKVRSCSCETCDFSGIYAELRKHARSEHPYVRPTEVDPMRLHDWARMERERDFDDVLSSLQSTVEERTEDDRFSLDFDYWLTLDFLDMFLFLRPLFETRGGSSDGEQVHNGRDSRTSRESYDIEPRRATRWRNNSPSATSNRGQRLRWQDQRGSPAIYDPYRNQRRSTANYDQRRSTANHEQRRSTANHDRGRNGRRSTANYDRWRNGRRSTFNNDR